MGLDSCQEVFLQPGDYYFGAAPERIRTLLGSCIAITLWHPLMRRGGMVHCLLPSRGAPAGATQLNGRFVDEGVRWLLRQAIQTGIDPVQCELKLFGGSNMFAGFGLGAGRRPPIGDANAGKAVELLARLGLAVRVQDVGGIVHRALMFDLATGDVWVRYGEPVQAEPGAQRECA